MNIFIINAGIKFGHSAGEYNTTLASEGEKFFLSKKFNVKRTDLSKEYNNDQEVEKFLWADTIIYHTPIWWFYIPFQFKQYLDTVLTNGRGKLYSSDGRTTDNNSKTGYGTGGKMQGKNYILCTTWNSPLEAFSLPGEFFQGRSVDDGALFAFHKMNQFLGLQKLNSIHFYDVSKAPDINRDIKAYINHLENEVRLPKI